MAQFGKRSVQYIKKKENNTIETKLVKWGWCVGEFEPLPINLTMNMNAA